MCLVALGSRKKAKMETWGIILLVSIIINTHVTKVLLGSNQSQLNW